MKLPSREKDFNGWYNEIVLRAELADYSPVRGCMVIRPYGYAIWENIREILDKKIKKTGAQNAYFPLFIPEEFIKREKKHIEGFSPELAVVTYGGGRELEEKLIVRPTSETIMYSMFSKWIHSWRDLPFRINQWANIVRWEKRTRLFLRTTEFLWQEGHTAHETYEEAERETLKILSLYKDFMENHLAIPVIDGFKSDSQRFAGALRTYAVEAMMGDRKALQMGTSHLLGQNFSKPFDIKFQDKDNKMHYVWQTSWGVSSRIVGAVVMVHGDSRGLVLPPRIAPVQVVVIPIWKDEEERKEVFYVCDKLAKELKGIRYKIDTREEYTPGWKFNEWELRGVPLRIEIGPRDVETDKATLKRRDTNEKIGIPIDRTKETTEDLLKEIQENLLKRARIFLKENIHRIDNYPEFVSKMEEGGFIGAHWCGKRNCEDKIQEETKATVRVIPIAGEKEKGSCIYCGSPSTERVIFAKAY